MSVDPRTSDEALATAEADVVEAATAYGPEDERTVVAVQTLAFTHHARQEPRSAAPLYRRLLPHWLRLRGADSDEVLNTARTLAGVLADVEEFDESLAVHAWVVSRTVQRHGEASQQAIGSRYNHALTRFRGGDEDRARRELTDLLTVARTELGADDVVSIEIAARLADWGS